MRNSSENTLSVHLVQDTEIEQWELHCMFIEPPLVRPQRDKFFYSAKPGNTSLSTTTNEYAMTNDQSTIQMVKLLDCALMKKKGSDFTGKWQSFHTWPFGFIKCLE